MVSHRLRLFGHACQCPDTRQQRRRDHAAALISVVLSPWRADSCQQGQAPRQTFGRPVQLAVVIRRDGWRASCKTSQACFEAVKMWISGGNRSSSSSVPTRTKRIEDPMPACCSRPRPGIADSVRSSGPCRCSRACQRCRAPPASRVTRSASIIAFRANEAPLSRWHQRQWQQWTDSRGDSRR